MKLLHVSEYNASIYEIYRSPTWAEGTVLSLCAHVCLLTPNLLLRSFISKSKQAVHVSQTW